MQRKKEISYMRNWYETYKNFECFARYEGSEQERSIWYHGTKESNLKSILSQGLIANPKNRLWGTHDDANFYTPSQASIGGIYVTRNLLTARISAQHNLPKNENRIIVIMELQPRSLVSDEDNLTHFIKSVLNNPKYGSHDWLICEIFMAKNLLTYSEYVNETKDKYIELGVKLLDQHYGPMHEKLRERVTKILEDGWEIVLNRQAAHIGDYQWRQSFYRNISSSMKEKMELKSKEISNAKVSQEKKEQMYHDFVETLIPAHPDINEYENKYLRFIDLITRAVKDAARPIKKPEMADRMSARSTENIGFNGSNRIIGIVEVDGNMDVTLIYGSMPDDFKKQWEESTGPLNIINQQNKAAMSKGLKKTAYKAVWYHGTLIENYPKIMSEGLLADPSKRLWDKKDQGDIVAPSKASLSGIYMTHELLDAIDAPGNALDAMEHSTKIDKSILLAIIQADTQGVFIDEDVMSFDVSAAIEGVSDFLTCLIYISHITGADQPYFEKMRERFVYRQMQMINRKFNLIHPDLISRIEKIFRDGFINALTRQVSHAEPKEWQKAYVELSGRQKNINKNEPELAVPPMPSVTKGEELFRQLMDQLTRTLKFSKHQQEKENGQWWDSGRYPQNISFSGATKILALIEVFVRSNKEKYLSPKDYKYKLLYGKLPTPFLKDWEYMIELSKLHVEDLDDISYSIKEKKLKFDKKKNKEEQAYEDWYENLTK